MIRSNVFALWPIVPFGGEPDEADNSGAGGAGGATGAGGANPPGSQQNSGATGSPASGGTGTVPPADDDDDDADKYKGYSVAELRRIAADNDAKATAAKAEADRLKGEEQARQRKKNDDVTNLTNDVTTLKEENSRLRATVTRQALEGAIRDDKRFEWHDVEMVAAQLDYEVVKVGEDGKVEGLKGQLPKVAKNHPFLVAKDNSSNDGDGKNNQQNQNNNNSQQNNNGPTGFQPGQGGNSNGDGSEVNAKVMVENYPALAGRI